MIVLLIIGGLVSYVLIAGICLYIKNPKPPNNGTYNDYYDYYHRIYNHIEIVPSEENETEKRRILKDMEFLQSHVDMLEDLQRLIETDLHNGSGNEKTNLSRLISIDKQIYTTQKKIDKLTDDLESLD